GHAPPPRRRSRQGHHQRVVRWHGHPGRVDRSKLQDTGRMPVLHRMADPIIPTPQDTQFLIQDTTTKTAAFNTPAADFGSGFSPGGLGKPVAGVVQVTVLDLADGNETYS